MEVELIHGPAELVLIGRHFDCIVTDPPPPFNQFRWDRVATRYILAGGTRWLKVPRSNVCPGGKRVEPYAAIIATLEPPPLAIVDPFMGTGSIGIAALSAGLNFLGVEQDRVIFEYCLNRISAEFPEAIITVTQ